MPAHVPIPFLMVLALVSASWLAFTMCFPAHWSHFVDQEHAWLRRRGILPRAVSELLSTFERGIVLKTILAGAVTLSVALIAAVYVSYFLGLKI